MNAFMTSGSILMARFFCLTIPTFLSSMRALTHLENFSFKVLKRIVEIQSFGNLSISDSTGKYCLQEGFASINFLISLTERDSYCGIVIYLIFSLLIYFLAPEMRSLRKSVLYVYKIIWNRGTYRLLPSCGGANEHWHQEPTSGSILFCFGTLLQTGQQWFAAFELSCCRFDLT